MMTADQIANAPAEDLISLLDSLFNSEDGGPEKYFPFLREILVSRIASDPEGFLSDEAMLRLCGRSRAFTVLSMIHIVEALLPDQPPDAGEQSARAIADLLGIELPIPPQNAQVAA